MRILRFSLRLAAFAGLLVLAVYVISVLTTPAAVPTQAESGSSGPPGAFGTTEQNNVTGYLQSFGYEVEAAGHPDALGGGLDLDSAVVLMPVQSPQFDPDHPDALDPETMRQVLMGFEAFERYFDAVSNIGVGLRWGEYVIMFPATTEAVRALQSNTLSTDDFWAAVRSNARVIDAQTWETVRITGLLYKDFSGSRRENDVLPPAVERPTSGQWHLRLQPSTAYLPTGADAARAEAALFATLTDEASRPVEGEVVEFRYATQEQDAQLITAAVTDSDGVARVPFSLTAGVRAPVGVGGDLLVSANSTGLGASAATLMSSGPLPTGTAASGVLSGSLGLQGYDVVEVASRDTREGTEIVALAEIASQQLDAEVRAQVLTMAGTTLTLYPQAAAAVPTLLYRTQGKSYLLRFRVARPDWQAWAGGTAGEAQLWRNITLAEVVDALTGQPLDEREFVSKNFLDTPDVTEISRQKSAQSRLITETWGVQLYTGEFAVPAGATADTFTTTQPTRAGFAIYTMADPTTPLYNSGSDADGSTLRALTLPTGRYAMSIEGGTAPLTVTLTYVEHLVDTGRIDPRPFQERR